MTDAMAKASGANGTRRSGGESARITEALAAYVVGSRLDDIPERVRNEGLRSILTWIGCAIGGARHETVDKTIAALLPFASNSAGTLLGRTERMDVMNAALVNGMSSIVLDYDASQYKKTNMHPSGPVLPPLIGLSEMGRVRGADLLHAYLLGIEVEGRVGNCVFGSGNNPGWHVTGAVGPLGAAAGAGKLLGLDARQMAHAFGIAATQAGGLREMYGTMCKSFTPGRAAQNGLLAAILAKQGFDSAKEPIEGKKALAHVLMNRDAPDEIIAKFGREFEVSYNAYKPYACAIVCHAAIDGCQRLLREHGFAPRDVVRIDLDVAPVALELAGNPEPQTGLASKFSVQHGVALALFHGDVSHHHFTDEMARSVELITLRRKVVARAEGALGKAQARVTIRLADGRSLSCFVEHALGSLENPMSDEGLSRKFNQLVEGVLTPAQSARLVELCWSLPKLDDASLLVRAAIPDA